MALRSGIGVRAYLGDVMSPLAIRALLVNRAESRGMERRESGWGRVPTLASELITCGPGEAVIIYRGHLEPGKYARARIPVPARTVEGFVTITATFCFTTPTDPQDSINYTRSGLEVTFRPNTKKRSDPNQLNADPGDFFLKAGYHPEVELRRDAHKWETTLHASRRLKGTSLHDPVFDIHYLPRKGGRRTSTAEKIPYALVITLSAPKSPELYNRIRQRYLSTLEVLTPVIEVPVWG